jgi:tetratricopeptide (TPR) repeat protein
MFRKPPGDQVTFGQFRFSAERTFPKKSNGEDGTTRYYEVVHPPDSLDSLDSPVSGPNSKKSILGKSRFRSSWWLVIAAPLTFFLLLEGGLRLFGVGHPAAFFRPEIIGGKPYFVGDPAFFLSFFPPSLVPYVDPVAVSERKRPDAYRIFVLGESAALGTPNSAFGFSRILDRMLRQRYPGIRFEIVNVSATAVNSHVLVPIAAACARRNPDLFIVYAGNNEVVGPYGPGTVFTPFAGSRAFIKASIALKRTRVGQWLGAEIRKAGGTGGAPVRWEGMEMFHDRTVSRDDPRLESVYANFQTNLRDILGHAQSSGAEVIFCTMGTNLRDNAPFASLPAPGLGEKERREWERHFREATDLAAEGKNDQALQSFDSALAIDASPAELHFGLGVCLLQSGQSARAADEFQQAEDRDALRFRADSRINAILRATARAAGSQGVPSGASPGVLKRVYMADADSAFRSASAGGLPGGDLFYEHVHLRFAGNHLLASTVLPKVDSALESAGRIASIPSDPPLALAQCRKDLALTGWDGLAMVGKILAMVGRPPFTAQRGHAERMAGLQSERDALNLYTANDSLQKALDEYMAAIAAYPDDPILHRDLAGFLYTCDQLPQAEAQYREALAAFPQDTRSRQMLAKCLAEQGRMEEAADEYAMGLRYEPDSPEMHNGLANGLARTGNLAGAVREYGLALKDNPPLPEIHFNLSKAYSGLGETGKAVEQLRSALRLDPAFTQASQELERLQGLGNEGR